VSSHYKIKFLDFNDPFGASKNQAFHTTMAKCLCNISTNEKETLVLDSDSQMQLIFDD